MSDQDYFSFHANDDSLYRFNHTKKPASSRVTSPGSAPNTAVQETHSPNTGSPITPISPGGTHIQHLYLHPPSNDAYLLSNQPLSPNGSSTNLLRVNRRPSNNRSQSNHQVVQQQVLHYPLGSNSSSAQSSRRTSLASATTNPNIHQSMHSSPNKNSKFNKIPKALSPTRSSSSSSERTFSNSASDSNLTTPTLIIPPDLASLKTHTTSSVTTPQHLHKTPHSHLNQTSNASISTISQLTNSSLNNIPTPTPNTNAVTSKLESLSSTPSTRSIMLANNASSKSFKKQYVLNEKIYLEKMKNNITDDDYYTRGIAPSPMLDDDLDTDEDLDLDFDDLLNNNNERKNGRGRSTSNVGTTGSSSIPSPERNNPDENINNSNRTGQSNQDDLEFGTNLFTTTYNNVRNDKNLVAMSSKYLLQRLEWLRTVDPNNLEITQIFEKIHDVTKNLSASNDQNDDIINGQYDAAIENTQKNYVSQLSEHPLVMERFKWQAMLSNVLKGDIVKNEKSKIASQVKKPRLNSQFSDEIWLELKAWMNGRNSEDLLKSLKILRDSTDVLFQEILDFKVPDGTSDCEIEMILTTLLKKYYKAVNYWPNLKKMSEDKPIIDSEEFTYRIDAMNSWLNFKKNFQIKIDTLKEWVGNDELNVLTPNDPPLHQIDNYTRSFAEQVMKEKDIETIFQKKIFFSLAPWILKSKVFFSHYELTLRSLNLTYPNEQLELLLMFPIRLVKEIILIRLQYAKKLKNPTMMMIDQMIDDFSSYIRLSVQLKYTVNKYCEGWSFNVTLDPEFDNTVIEAIRYLFKLFNLKLLDSNKKSFKTFKEPELILKYWDELKNIGHYIDNAGVLIAAEFIKVTLRLLHRLHTYLLEQQNTPPPFQTTNDAERWLTEIFENLGSMKRKLNRFKNVLTKAFQNSANYKVEDHQQLLRS